MSKLPHLCRHWSKIVRHCYMWKTLCSLLTPGDHFVSNFDPISARCRGIDTEGSCLENGVLAGLQAKRSRISNATDASETWLVSSKICKRCGQRVSIYLQIRIVTQVTTIGSLERSGMIDSLTESVFCVNANNAGIERRRRCFFVGELLRSSFHIFQFTDTTNYLKLH